MDGQLLGVDLGLQLLVDGVVAVRRAVAEQHELRVARHEDAAAERDEVLRVVGRLGKGLAR